MIQQKLTKTKTKMILINKTFYFFTFYTDEFRRERLIVNNC